MELGTYKFVKQPNQHTTRFGRAKFAVKAFVKKLIRLLGTMTALATLIVLIFTAGQWSKPDHVQAFTNTIVQSTEFPPMLAKICKAESGNRQFNSKGTVLRGAVNPSDIGFCQINEPTWNDKAMELGYNIYTEKGNKDMALYIFNHQGTDPWNSSKANWSK